MNKLTVGDVLASKEKKSKPVYWLSAVPENDDFGKPITSTFIDGRTIYGPWALMAPESHTTYGVGMGLGKGQMFMKKTDGRWVKVR